MAALPQTPRTRLERLLRGFGWTLLCLLGLLVALAIAVLIINAKDEALYAETQAWLQMPADSVAPANNAFLALVVIGIETRADTLAGKKLLEQLAANPSVLLNQAALTQLGPQWHADDVDTKLCSLSARGPHLMRRIIERSNELRALVDRHRSALDRYYAAIALPGFRQITINPEILPFTPSIRAACLARIDLVLRLNNGEHGAIGRFAAHTQAWHRYLTHSESLINMVIAAAQIGIDLDLIADLKEKTQLGKDSLFPQLRPQLERLVAMPIPQLRTHVLAGELRFTQQLMTASEALQDGQDSTTLTSSVNRFFESALFKPQATLNFQQRLMALSVVDKNADVESSCDIFQLNYLYNPIGKTVGCTGLHNYAEYFQRINQVQSDAAKLLKSN